MVISFSLFIHPRSPDHGMVPPTSRVCLLNSINLIQKLHHRCAYDSRPCQNDNKCHLLHLQSLTLKTSMPSDQGSDGTVAKPMRASIAVRQLEKATFKLASEYRQEFDQQSREGKDSEQREPTLCARPEGQEC